MPSLIILPCRLMAEIYTLKINLLRNIQFIHTCINVLFLAFRSTQTIWCLVVIKREILILSKAFCTMANRMIYIVCLYLYINGKMLECVYVVYINGFINATLIFHTTLNTLYICVPSANNKIMREITYFSI